MSICIRTISYSSLRRQPPFSGGDTQPAAQAPMSQPPVQRVVGSLSLPTHVADASLRNLMTAHIIQLEARIREHEAAAQLSSIELDAFESEVNELHVQNQELRAMNEELQRKLDRTLTTLRGVIETLAL
ncbi:uncharacterized protein EI90DRAFT_3117883 [Cantharellus anzutake]|uniref:uncharacterized protein n=1 Tax=Cantharellus anzutake TaxID=1750568 RepID=UPI0019074D32|nr:uncharacterized protein EI90DRAFT_3117883 [Cantharellus anzutake]KAF8338812.1 hypothetical protein EI90DRAFT_3117883 [Cantharellus anzutake]